LNAYKVTIAAGVTIHAGILVLHSSQARARMHRLTALGGNRYEVSDPPVQFKRGETFGFEGELPKGMGRSVEAIPISGLGKWVLHRPRAPVHDEKKMLQIPRAIPEQQNAARTASATTTREARKANRLRALRRFIDDVYEALDNAGHEIGKKGHRKPLPVSAGDLHTLFRTRHPEHKVARSTFNDDLGTNAWGNLMTRVVLASHCWGDSGNTESATTA
jgi:hypothetical protein